MRKRIILLIALLTVVLAFASCKNKTKYTVSVKLAEGEQLIGSITTKVGKKVLIGDVINETSVQKEGHIFKGWSIDGSSLVDKQLVITEDILLIPLFEVNSYKIKYTKGTLNAAFTGDSVDGLSGSTNYSDYANSNINATGGGQAHNNMMPYITCYIWKRVA